MKKVVLAYSGGLDTSVAVAWLKEQYGAEVVTLTVDLGGGSIREGVERRALSAGATKAYVVDAQETFVSQYVWPRAAGRRDLPGRVPARHGARPAAASPSSWSRSPSSEGADAVAHGCTGKGNDQVRFDVAVQALDPGLEVIAPMRVGMGLTRDQAIDYANARGIEIPITKSSPLLDRRQPLGPLVRDRRARGPVGDAARRRLRLDRRARRRAGRRSTS